MKIQMKNLHLMFWQDFLKKSFAKISNTLFDSF